jgi:hypothetical protein
VHEDNIMMICPLCDNIWSYGWPCIAELQLYLMYSRQWKCSCCGIVFQSNEIITESEEYKELKKDANLRL